MSPALKNLSPAWRLPSETPVMIAYSHFGDYITKFKQKQINST